MNYHLVPTTVFTPFEYGLCGLSEEAAIVSSAEMNYQSLKGYNPQNGVTVQSILHLFCYRRNNMEEIMWKYIYSNFLP